MNAPAAAHVSYWMATAPPGPLRPPLDGEVDADVVVVGGGIVGLSTAWELARAGRRPVVLEADRIAAGVTGHTTAKLSVLHTRIYATLRSTRGPEAARQYARSQSLAVRRAAELADLLGIDCDWEDTEAFTFAQGEDLARELKEEAEAAREAGLPAEYVTRTGLPFPVAGAVKVTGQAQFHPRKYLLALAEDLERRGGTIHEGTRVTELKEGEPCELRTEAGASVRARHVVVATHYPVFDRSLAFIRLSPRRELVLTAPIPADRDPGGMYITQEQGTRSVRTAPWHEGRRLLIVTGEHHTPGTADVEARFAKLAAWARRHFGEDLEFTHRWATQDNDSTDKVPFVGPLHPGADHAWVATGFGGWGMSGGIMAGHLLTELIEGRTPEWARLYDPRRLRPVLAEAPELLKNQVKVAKHFVGDRVTALGGSVADVAPGEGAVLRIGGRPCAVHRDDDGTLHAVSATCTHLGCLIAFNSAERAWECPCHGSRFAPDGEVLQGPAVRPLEKRDVLPDDGD